MSPLTRRRLTWGLIAVAVVVAVGQGTTAVRKTARDTSILEVYREAGRAVIEGGDPYEAVSADGDVFLYPPTFALMAVPLVMVSAQVAAIAWYVVNLLLFALAVLLAAELAAPLGGSRLRRIAWTALLTFPYASHNFVYGQASPWMVALPLAALWAMERGRARGCGALLAAGLALKPLGGIVALDLLRRREFKALVWSAIVLVVLVLLLPAIVRGPEQALADVGSFVEAARGIQGAGQGTSFMNQSLRAALERWGMGETTGLAHALIALLLVVVTFWVTLRSRPPRAISAGLWFCLVPCIASTGWKHHYLVLILPYAALTAAWEHLPRSAKVLAVLSAVLTFSRQPELTGSTVSDWLGAQSVVLFAALTAWAALLRTKEGSVDSRPP